MFANLRQIKNAEIINHDALINSKVFELEKRQVETMDQPYKQPDLDVKVLLFDINKEINEVESQATTVLTEISTATVREPVDASKLLLSYNKLANLINFKRFRELPQRDISAVTDRIDALVEPVNAIILSAIENLPRVQKEFQGEQVEGVRQYFPLFEEVRDLYTQLLYRTYDIIRSRKLAQDIIQRNILSPYLAEVNIGGTPLAPLDPKIKDYLSPEEREQVKQYENSIKEEQNKISNIRQEILLIDSNIDNLDAQILQIKSDLDGVSDPATIAQLKTQLNEIQDVKTTQFNARASFKEEITLKMRRITELRGMIKAIKEGVNIKAPDVPLPFQDREDLIVDVDPEPEETLGVDRRTLINFIDSTMRKGAGILLTDDLKYIGEGIIYDLNTARERQATNAELLTLKNKQGMGRNKKQMIMSHRAKMLGRGIVPMDRGDWLYETY